MADNKKSTFSLLLFLINFALVTPASAVSFTRDDTIFPNPERGFHTLVELHPRSSLPQSPGDSTISLYHLNVRLDNFIHGPISAEMLTTLTTAFTAARTQQKKLTVRFLYNAGPYPNCNPDAAESIIHTHLVQLHPILAEASDVIVAFDAGFIGCWAEWHTSTNNLLTTPVKTRIYRDILAHTPDTRQVRLRTPKDIQDIWPSLNYAEQSRVSHHNDCFLASETDMGTYSSPATDKVYLANLTDGRYVGGETCAVSSRTSCNTALSELTQLHFSHLNLGYHPSVIQQWKNEGCFDEINRRLGYRYNLISASYPTTAHTTSPFSLGFTVNNSGFSSLINPRQVKLVFFNSSGTYSFPLRTDPKNWKPGLTTEVAESLNISTLPPGTYSLALSLPDPSPSLADRSGYSIRFANKNTWDETRGYNIIGHNIGITLGSSAPKLGDLNGDGSVNLLDFNLLISKFFNPYTLLDFNAIISHYGR